MQNHQSKSGMSLEHGENIIAKFHVELNMTNDLYCQKSHHDVKRIQSLKSHISQYFGWDLLLFGQVVVWIKSPPEPRKELFSLREGKNRPVHIMTLSTIS